jgi:hypothetical protein
MLKHLSTLTCIALLCACGDGSDTGISSEPGPPNPGLSGDGAPAINSPPTISGTPPRTAVAENPYDFRPVASDSDGDSIEFHVANKPPWTTFDHRTGRLNGTPSVSDLGTWSNIEIGVSDGTEASTLPLFAITVERAPQGAVLIGWNPPTANTDDSPLTDLAGYNIYWGTDPANLNESLTITTPGATNHIVGDLSAGTYYFAVSAFNGAMVESELSQSVATIVN